MTTRTRARGNILGDSMIDEIDDYGRPNRTKALAEGVWGVTRMIGCGNTMMSDGLVARMVWIACEDGWDRL